MQIAVLRKLLGPAAISTVTGAGICPACLELLQRSAGSATVRFVTIAFPTPTIRTTTTVTVPIPLAALLPRGGTCHLVVPVPVLRRALAATRSGV